jgi:hypothetical protein
LGDLEIIRVLYEKATGEDGSCGDKNDILGMKPKPTAKMLKDRNISA